ncbi:hypothetical protein QBC46DRAFT_339077 [Diplogelasinospora grovesii]|uniref:Uncharacterized protein n=1 Tax=Diplogelasinospora grovesii TaxID=303347 RepID=A0AAN6NBP1_9PEZI|nr:hypothetical protein QBC46DRAFT_339077 [Diplogelasinospora grovesii]
MSDTTSDDTSSTDTSISDIHDEPSEANAANPEDLVERFFQDMATPGFHYANQFWHIVEWKLRMACDDLAAAGAKVNSWGGPGQPDPDFADLLFHCTPNKRGTYRGLKNHIAKLALSKTDISEKEPEDCRSESAKTRQLRYYRWMAQGYKDETWPFHQDDDDFMGYQPTYPTSMPADYHASLPTYRINCENCDRLMVGQAWGRSAGCAIWTLYPPYRVILSAAYCSQRCADTESRMARHAPICSEMRSLKRAAEIYMELFTAISAVTYERQLIDVYEKNGILVAEGIFDDDDNMLSARGIGKGVLREFPWELCKNEEQGRAILFASTCWQTLDTARVLFEYLFRVSGVTETVEKVIFYPKNLHKPVCEVQVLGWDETIHEYNALMSHEISLLTLPSGTQVVFDPSAAQYGWREHVAPWDAYQHHRIYDIERREELDRQIIPDLLQIPHDIDQADTSERAQRQLFAAVSIAFNGQLAKRWGERVPLRELLKRLFGLAEEEYQAEKADIMGMMKKVIGNEVAELKLTTNYYKKTEDNQAPEPVW